MEARAKRLRPLTMTRDKEYWENGHLVGLGCAPVLPS